jgi:hypothetical protein
MNLAHTTDDINAALKTLGCFSDLQGSVSVNCFMLVKLMILLDQWEAERTFNAAMQEMDGLEVPAMIAKLLLALQHLESHGVRSSALLELKCELDGLVQAGGSMEIMTDLMHRTRAEVATLLKSRPRSAMDQLPLSGRVQFE